MTAHQGPAPERDYSVLPTPVKLEDTLGSIDPSRRPDADDVRNVDQHGALRED